MAIKSILITVNRDIISKEVFEKEPKLLCIPYQAVVILGTGDSFSDGLKKFLYSFYQPSEWHSKEVAAKTLYYFEPIPYEGNWSATIEKCGQKVNLTGIFKQINYVAF